MRNLKRVLSTVMAVAMMMSLMVFSTSAAFPDQTKITNTDAVDMCVALNIIQGRDTGEFDPEGGVTRAEMCKMIAYIKNGGTEPTLGTKFQASFSDIQGHWAEAYIEYCYSLGIIAGMGDGTFAPDAGVTGTQASKMLLVTLGYDAIFEQFNGVNWAVKINAQASVKGLYEDLGANDPNAALNRDDAAQMIWNALKASEVKYTYSLTTVDGQLMNIQVREDKSGTLLIACFKTDADNEGIMSKYTWVEKDKKFEYSVRHTDSDDKTTTVKYKSAKDYTDMFGLNVNVVKKTVNGTTTVYGIYAADSVVMASGSVEDLDKSADGEIKFGDDKYDTSFKMLDSADADDADIIADIETAQSKLWTAFSPSEKFLMSTPVLAENVYDITYYGLLEDADAYEARLIDWDNDGDADYVVYLPFTAATVDSVGTKNITLDTIAGKTVTKATFADDTIYANPEEDDVVVVIAEANHAYSGQLVSLMDSFDGTVDGIDTSANEYHVSSTWYTDVPGDLGIQNNAEYTFYAVGNYIYSVDELSNATLDNVVFITSASATNWDKKAKAHFVDGSSATINLNKVRVYSSSGNSTTDLDNEDISLIGDTENVDGSPARLFTYTEKNGSYTLTEVCEKNRVGFKSFEQTATGNASVTASTTKKDGQLKIGSNAYNFADDAVVFVLYNGDDVKVLTGKQAKKLSENKALSADLAIEGANAQVVYNTSGNLPSVKLAAIDAYGQAKLPGTSGDASYAYLLSRVTTRTINGDDYYQFTAWTEGGEKTLRIAEDDDSAGVVSALKKGCVIGFEDIGDDVITDVIALDYDFAASPEDAWVGYAQVTGYSSSNVQVDILTGSAAMKNKTNLYLTSDTVVLGVDTDAVEGLSTSGSIKTGDTDIANVLVFVDEDSDDGDEILLIVIDSEKNYLAPTP